MTAGHITYKVTFSCCGGKGYKIDFKKDYIIRGRGIENEITEKKFERAKWRVRERERERERDSYLYIYI